MYKLSMRLVVLFLAAFCIVQCHHQTDVEAEKEMIKKVVQTQLDFAKEFNVKGEAATWAHEPYVIRYDVFGWDSVLAYYEDNFPKYKEEYLINEFTAYNFDIHINGNFAAVFHEEKLVGTQNNEEMTRINKNLKYLEKINGEWKMIAQFQQ